ncbi:MAG: DALR anticodon-binding domain-containing protein, partial [Egibacteraceae bacterium]
ELIDEVGPDAARYTFLRFSNEVTIDFDVDAVVRQHRENPIYYVQYSHARIAGIMRTATERGVVPGSVDQAPLDRLVHDTETELIRRIGAFPETVAYAAAERAPHRVAHYAEDLAEGFHRFYTECQVVGPDADLTRARYWLCVAARQTLVNALGLLGVSAPDRM